MRAERALRPSRGARRVEDRREVLGFEVDRRAARRRREPCRARLPTLRRPDARSRRSGRRSSRCRAAGSTSARRSSRSPSTNTTFAPESRRPYSSSSAVHHAFSGTTIAPAAAAAQNAIDHSGKFRMTMATRSPFSTPYRSTRIVARCAAARKCSSNVSVSSSYTMNGASSASPAGFEDHAQRCGRVLPHSQPRAEDLGLVHLEHRRRRRERGVRLGDARPGCGVVWFDHGSYLLRRRPGTASISRATRPSRSCGRSWLGWPSRRSHPADLRTRPLRRRPPGSLPRRRG